MIACILDKGHDIDVYVLELFKVETYMATYKNVINPIKGKELWPESNILMLPPPWYVATKGRKQTKRIKGPEEVEVS